MNAGIRHLNIEVTKKCNQRCFYCFNDSGRGQSETDLSLQQWLTMLRNLQQKGLQSIHLTGGEPFAYKNAVELLAGAQAIGLSTSILSNGLHVEALTSDFPNIFRKLTVAQISLDSMDEATHNLRRGYSKAWHDAVSAIHALHRLSVPVEISCVVSEGNLSDLGEVAEFCRTVNGGLIVRPMIAIGRAANECTPDSFAHDLELCIQVLKASQHVRLVSDRFQYVTDKQEAWPQQYQEGIQTAHHDGRLRFVRKEEANLIALAA
ncbi:MAG: radical SAM protein [Anaerolineales bacterium]